MRYILSDTHFDHGNIIEYCDRPFRSVEEMNERLVTNWNETVDETDEVFFLGDLTIAGTAEAFLSWVDRLAGEIVFVVGDHDEAVIPTLDRVTVCEHFHLDHGGTQFYCVHDPAEGPLESDQWVLHGHHHNNWPEAYPLVNPQGKLVNVSVELLEYTPLSLDTLVRYIERDEWIQSVEDPPPVE